MATAALIQKTAAMFGFGLAPLGRPARRGESVHALAPMRTPLERALLDESYFASIQPREDARIRADRSARR